MLTQSDYAWAIPSVREQEDINSQELFRFFKTIEQDPVQLYTLQITWLKSFYPHRLGREFSGSYGTGEIVSTTRGALNLLRLANYKLRQVETRKRYRLPFVEGLVKFKRLTYSFLPNAEPAVFLDNKEVVTYRHLLSQGRGPAQAVNYVLRRIRGA